MAAGRSRGHSAPVEQRIADIPGRNKR